MAAADRATPLPREMAPPPVPPPPQPTPPAGAVPPYAEMAWCCFSPDLIVGTQRPEAEGVAES